jgi:hypothetical protein
MKNFILPALFLLFFSFAQQCFSQAPGIEWQRVLGNQNGDYPKKILATNDGGSIVAGYREGNIKVISSNSAMLDAFIWVVKLDASGNIQWENHIIGNATYAADMVQTPDGGFLVVTSAWVMEPCEEQGKNVDVYAIRLNAQGEVLWKKHYGGPGIEDGYAVAVTPDNQFIIAGMSRVNNADENFYVIKIDASGNLLWEKILGGSSSDMAFSVVVATDGSCLVGGETFSNNGAVSGNHGQRDAWLVKLSSAGVVQWQKCFGGSMFETCYKLALSYSGGFIAAIAASSSDGNVNGNKGASDFWIVDLSPSGNINWNRCYGGMFNEIPYDIQHTPDNGYVVTGSAESANGDLTCNKGLEDTWLIKLTATGTLQWQKGTVLLIR